MSQKLKTIKVICKNSTCNFVGIYNNTTIEIIKKHREFWLSIPSYGNECPHTEVDIIEDSK